MLEIEVKIKVKNLKDIIEKIEACGAVLKKARYFEENTLYDFSTRELFRKKHALRFRTINRKTFLTYKGAVQKSRKFKIRDEFETEVKNRIHSRKILHALGLSPVYTYNKHRTVYRHKRLNICVDETPVGNFIELEGKRGDIVKFSAAIGFTKDKFIKSDYIQLMERARKKSQVE